MSPVSGLECTGKLGSAGPEYRAVTHVDGGDKTVVRVHFTPDEGVEQEPEFEIIVLKDYSTYWSNLLIWDNNKNEIQELLLKI